MYRSDKIQLIEYYIEPRIYNRDFSLFELVNEVVIINQFTNANVIVNNVVLIPGQEFSSGGNYAEINNQQYNVTINLTGALPLSGNVLVLLKRYKNVTQ
jgi:short-subunit dehydrogenase involved in D-alanine esterification of teichoic acids